MQTRKCGLFRKPRTTRLAVAGCALAILCACATTGRIQESAQNPKAAGELAQDIALAGAVYKLLLPAKPDLILLGIAYMIYDPLAPNWEVETIRVGDDVFQMQLTMKRLHAGGEGEAQYIFRRNAHRITRAAGYDDYRVVRYEEGIESASIMPRRFGEGEIQLLKNQ